MMSKQVRGITPCIVYGAKTKDGTIHYIGQTILSLTERENIHRQSATPYGTAWQRYLWACDIVGMDIEFFTIRPNAVWDVDEMQVISESLDFGHPLKNGKVPHAYTPYVVAGQAKKAINAIKGTPYGRNATIEEAVFKLGLLPSKVIPFTSYLGVSYVHELYDLKASDFINVPGFGPYHTSAVRQIMSGHGEDMYDHAYQNMIAELENNNAATCRLERNHNAKLDQIAVQKAAEQIRSGARRSHKGLCRQGRH